MGYRARLLEVRKYIYNDLKSLTSEQVNSYCNIDEDDCFYPPEISKKDLHELGDFDITPFSFHKNFFEKDCINEKMSDFDFKVVEKEFLEQVIETYKKRISKYYNSMVEPFLGDSEFNDSIKTIFGEKENTYDFDESKLTSKQKSQIVSMINHIKSFRVEWTSDLVYDLNKPEEITKSWKYEYSIFELIRIYKTFDWDKNVMVYFGG